MPPTSVMNWRRLMSNMGAPPAAVIVRRGDGHRKAPPEWREARKRQNAS